GEHIVQRDDAGPRQPIVFVQRDLRRDAPYPRGERSDEGPLQHGQHGIPSQDENRSAAEDGVLAPPHVAPGYQASSSSWVTAARLRRPATSAHPPRSPQVSRPSDCGTRRYPSTIRRDSSSSDCSASPFSSRRGTRRGGP